jgi:hypothetical protein
MLGWLAPADQARLIAAMNTIETLLGGTTPDHPPQQHQYTLRAPKPGDFGWIVKRHAELYAEEYGWIEPFEGLCGQIVADFVNKYDPKRERCWIAEMDGKNVGSIMLVKDSENVTRRRAGWGSARGSPTNASASRGARATRRSRCGPTACSPPRGTFMRKPDSSSCAPSSTEAGAGRSRASTGIWSCNFALLVVARLVPATSRRSVHLQCQYYRDARHQGRA